MLALKRRYYLGLMDKKELEERGWEPCSLKITNTTMQLHLDTDNELCNSAATLTEIEDFCDFLKSIITTVSNRGFHIKNSIDFQKFQNGQ